MGIVVRQSIKGTFISYIGVLVGLVSTLWLLPYILTAEQIGLYRVIIDIATFLMIFAQVGMVNAGIKFFPHFKDQENGHNGFLFFMLVMVCIGFVLMGGVILCFKDLIFRKFAANSSMLIEFMYVILPLTFFLLLFTVFETYARSLLRIVVPKFLKEVLLRFLVAISVLAYYFDYLTFDQFIESLVLIYIVILIGSIIYVRSLKQLFVKPDLTVFKSNKLREIIVFCFFIIMLAGSGIIVGKIDTIMLTSLSGLSATGIYSIAFYMGIMVEIPKRSLVNISAPLVAQYFKDGAIEKIEILYKKTSTHLMLAAGVILGMVWFNIDDIFSLIPNSDIYIKGKWVVLFIGLAKLIDLTMSINTEILGNSEKYRWNLFLMPLLAGLAVITNYILIPKYGITGAAIASLISIGSYNIIRFFIVYFFFKITPFSVQTLKCILIFILIFLVGNFTPDVGINIIDIAIKSTAISLVAFAGVMILKPSEELLKIANRILELLKIKKVK